MRDKNLCACCSALLCKLSTDLNDDFQGKVFLLLCRTCYNPWFGQPNSHPKFYSLTLILTNNLPSQTFPFKFSISVEMIMLSNILPHLKMHKDLINLPQK